MPFLPDAIRMPWNRVPANAAPNTTMLYPKSDNNWYSRDTTGTDVLVGGPGLASVAYTPTTSGFTVGAGTVEGRYTTHGKFVHVRARAVLGAGFTISGTAGFGISLPMNAHATLVHGPMSGYFTEVGNNSFMAFPILNTTSVVQFVPGANGVATIPTTTIPFTWAATDEVVMSVIYEKA